MRFKFKCFFWLRRTSVRYHSGPTCQLTRLVLTPTATASSDVHPLVRFGVVAAPGQPSGQVLQAVWPSPTSPRGWKTSRRCRARPPVVGPESVSLIRSQIDTWSKVAKRAKVEVVV